MRHRAHRANSVTRLQLYQTLPGDRKFEYFWSNAIDEVYWLVQTRSEPRELTGTEVTAPIQLPAAAPKLYQTWRIECRVTPSLHISNPTPHIRSIGWSELEMSMGNGLVQHRKSPRQFGSHTKIVTQRTVRPKLKYFGFNAQEDIYGGVHTRNEMNTWNKVVRHRTHWLSLVAALKK